MTIEQTKIELSKATSIEHWNEIRQVVKRGLTTSEMSIIDTSGLIQKTKKNNNWQIGRAHV